MPLYPPPSSGATSSISELSNDPGSPTSQSTWMLWTQRQGIPIGLLLSLTYSQDVYQLSYKTTENTIIRTNLS